MKTVYSKTYRGPSWDEKVPVDVCPFCGQTLYWTGIIFDGKAMWVKKDQCDCEEARRKREQAEKEEARYQKAKENWEKQRKVNRLLKLSGVQKAFRLRTFDSYKPTNASTRRAKDIALQYAAQFKKGVPRKEKNSLIFCGPVGTGKTHLASSIANQLIDELVDVIIMTPTEMLDRQIAAYNRRGEDMVEDITKSYKQVSLLIIDDLGKDRVTEWGLGRIFDVVNYRYESLMPMIITTNDGPKELIKRLTPAGGYSTTAQAIVDRLIERCEIVTIEGESYRTSRGR